MESERWARSKKSKVNKWHRVRGSGLVRGLPAYRTRCGQRIQQGDATSEVSYNRSAPEDEHGVCKHCLVWVEEDTRASE